MTKPLTYTRRTGKSDGYDLKKPKPVGRDGHPSIQWASDVEIRSICTQLLEARQVGIDLEAKGDSFRSGDLAFQIQEIIMAAREVVKISRRTGPCTTREGDFPEVAA